MIGNQMETISLKALALKVLPGNSQGNQMETIPGGVGNFEDKNKGKSFPVSIEDFKTKSLAIRIRSRILGEDIWLVSNKETRSHLEAEGLVCYLADEISHLKRLSPASIRKIHEIKRIFSKSIIEK